MIKHPLLGTVPNAAHAREFPTHELDIHLDGVKQHAVIAYNVDGGWVERYDLHKGRPVHTGEGFKVERVYGDVSVGEAPRTFDITYKGEHIYPHIGVTFDGVEQLHFRAYSVDGGWLDREKRHGKTFEIEHLTGKVEARWLEKPMKKRMV